MKPTKEQARQALEQLINQGVQGLAVETLRAYLEKTEQSKFSDHTWLCKALGSKKDLRRYTQFIHDFGDFMLATNGAIMFIVNYPERVAHDVKFLDKKGVQSNEIERGVSLNQVERLLANHIHFKPFTGNLNGFEYSEKYIKLALNGVGDDCEFSQLENGQLVFRKNRRVALVMPVIKKGYTIG